MFRSAQQRVVQPRRPRQIGEIGRNWRLHRDPPALGVRQLQSRGIWIFGTSDKGDRGLYETDFTGPAALVMGAEGEGMRRLTEENCDFLLRIPMKGSIPCLNVSVATGVCLYEMVRQRS